MAETWDKPASEEVIEKTIKALKNNGINAMLVEGDEQAVRNKIIDLIPAGSEVMNMTSVTLDTLGILDALKNSNKYKFTRDELEKLNREENNREMQRLGAAPEFAIGSVHAVTQDGKVLVASNTGSQLPAYVYGSDKVIWIVGTQKIVKDLDEAMKRIYEYTLPLESERAKKAYGVPGSFVSKLLIFNKEVTPNRVILLFVNQNIGY